MPTEQGERAARVWALIAESAGDGVATAEHVCAASLSTLGVSGAAVWLASETDRRALVHATDDVGRQLDDWQFTLGEGPCVEAWELGGLVLVADLSSLGSRSRWPMFAPAAVAAERGRLFVFPLQVGAIRVGTLEVYRTEAGPLSDEQLADALAFALAMLKVLLAAADASSDGDGDGGVWPFDGLGEGRIEIYQATGMVAGQLGISLAEALSRLRGYAFAQGIPLSQVASRVVERTLVLPAVEVDQ